MLGVFLSAFSLVFLSSFCNVISVECWHHYQCQFPVRFLTHLNSSLPTPNVIRASHMYFLYSVENKVIVAVIFQIYRGADGWLVNMLIFLLSLAHLLKISNILTISACLSLKWACFVYMVIVTSSTLFLSHRMPSFFTIVSFIEKFFSTGILA